MMARNCTGTIAGPGLAEAEPFRNVVQAKRIGQRCAVAARPCGEPDGVWQGRASARPARYTEFGADVVFAVGAAGGDVGVGFGDRLLDAGL